MLDDFRPVAAAMLGVLLVGVGAPLLGFGLPATLLGALVAGSTLGWAAVQRSRAAVRARVDRIFDAMSSSDPSERPGVAVGPAGSLDAIEAAVVASGSRAEASLRELRIEQERLEAVLAGMLEGVVVIDLEGRVTLSNAPARALLDLPDDISARGARITDVVRVPAMTETLRALQAGERVITRDFTMHGAAERSIQLNAAEIRGRNQRLPFGYVLVLHDVTELRRLEVIRRDFVANVSHEIRTPLTAIKGYAETLLGSAGEDRETARRFLTVIDRHSERLGRLIDDLLTLSDLEMGRSPLHLGEVDVAGAVDDVAQILAEAANRKHVRLVASMESDVGVIRADGDRVRQVLINLVDNAIKYTPEGGLVTVRAGQVREVDGVCIRLSVEDNGPGIPARDLARITERFFRVDKARSRELGGTGLGLAIVKHIVQLHGGRMEVASTVGKGTTVSVFFPAVACEQASAPQAG